MNIDKNHRWYIVLKRALAFRDGGGSEAAIEDMSFAIKQGADGRTWKPIKHHVLVRALFARREAARRPQLKGGIFLLRKMPMGVSGKAYKQGTRCRFFCC